MIDLTHPFSSTNPTWNGGCGFHLEVKQDYDKTFLVQQIKMHAGICTHMDAPCHRFEGAKSIDQIPLSQLIVPACVIDVSSKADAHYLIIPADIHEYEKTYGRIPKNTLVIGYTSWDKHWSDPDAYRNVNAQEIMQFPSFSEDSAELLLERDIAGIAIDTLSPDCPGGDFPVHKLILGAGKYIIENIANAALLPKSGAQVLALPLYAVGASEAPLRIIALI